MTKHLPRLDSLRGIAALMVAGFHAGLSGGESPGAGHVNWFLRFFFDGRNGICIFFVLSGLVLGLSLRRAGALTAATYFHFCGRRFFRLYPAYFVSSLLYLGLYLIVRYGAEHRLPVGHGWCDYYETSTLPWRTWLENFCFLHQFLNPASWTLKVELQAAFIFPFFHFFSARFPGRGSAGLLAALVALSLLSLMAHGGSTRVYLYLFYLGYLLPSLLDPLRNLLTAQKMSRETLIIGGAIFALLIAHLFPNHGLNEGVGILSASLGAVVLMAILLLDSSHPVFAILDQPLVRFLGTVSYSFYLLNLFSVDLTERLFYLLVGRNSTETLLGWWIVFPLSSLLCLALSAVSFYLVERPAIRLGGHLLARGRNAG